MLPRVNVLPDGVGSLPFCIQAERYGTWKPRGGERGEMENGLRHSSVPHYMCGLGKRGDFDRLRASALIADT